MNILWIQPNNTLALTSIFDSSNPADHAALLQERGDIPADWKLAAVAVEWPDTGLAHECYRWNGSAIVVDISAAREETILRLRRERAPLLMALDIQYQRAMETGADLGDIIKEKVRLRNITQLVDDAGLNELQGLHAWTI